MDEREMLAASLRRLRQRSGMTLREVSELTGVALFNVYRSENGMRPPLSARTQARVFGVPVAEVWALCPHCGYRPPAGYMCLTCRTKGNGEEST